MSDTQPTTGSNPVPATRTAEQADGTSAISEDGSKTPEGKGIEFALVLARMIESVKSDPDQMRAAIYQLARHKLDEQVRSEKPDDIRNIKGSLEIAIQGVEHFYRDDSNRHAHQSASRFPPHSIGPADRTDVYRLPMDEPTSGVQSRERPLGTTRRKLAATGLVILPFAIGLFALLGQPDRWVFPRNPPQVQTSSQPPVAAPQPAPPPLPTSAANVREPPPPARDPLVPMRYGIYAVAGDKLVALKLFPIPAPDVRIAISAAFESTGETFLPSGKVRFLVYRRERANGPIERAEVRIVAKIVGTNPPESADIPERQKWVIRNVSFPYRIAPLKDHPEIDELTSETDNAELSAGRYALVLNKEAYDFSVAGASTNPQHCLERVAAANGTFYSQCTSNSKEKR